MLMYCNNLGFNNTSKIIGFNNIIEDNYVDKEI